MGVFTLYNCGTDYHRGSNDIVAQLWRETTSDCEINDGIGSPGENNGGALTATGATLHDDWRNNIPKVGPLMGSAFGVDIDNNVAAGLNVIKRRLKRIPNCS